MIERSIADNQFPEVGIATTGTQREIYRQPPELRARSANKEAEQT